MAKIKDIEMIGVIMAQKIWNKILEKERLLFQVNNIECVTSQWTLDK